MSHNNETLVFAAGNAQAGIGEVIRAALFRGELDDHLRNAAWAKKCVDAAAEEGLDADEGAIGELMERFRYENDLITAEDTEAWLSRRGLDVDDFYQYFCARQWRDRLQDRISRDPIDPLGISADQLDRLVPDVFMSGSLVPLATGLLRRLAAGTGAGAGAGRDRIDAERALFFARASVPPERLGDWLGSLDRDAAWFERMLGLEAAFRMRCEMLLAPENLPRAMAAARLPLTRLEFESMEFDSMDAAREALLCVRDDGMSMEGVATESRFPYRRAELFAEDMPEDLRQVLLCAGVGEILEPVSSGGVVRLYRLLGKLEPALSDSLVRGKIEQRVLEAHLSGKGAADVRWFVR